MKQVFVLYLLISCWAYALPSEIENMIQKSEIPKNDMSIYIKETGVNTRVLASLNASKTHTPASVIKVLSTYASVLKLGFDYRWPTQFYITGAVKNGVLYGDLLVKGFGDPTLSSKDLDNIVANIKAKGIRRVTGDIVIDRSYFAVGTKDNSGFDKYTYSPYNAMPDAMMFNERVSTIYVIPNKDEVSKKDVDGSYIVRNHLQRVNKPCRGRYSWPAVKIDKSKAIPEVLLKGKISKRCGKRNICKVITKPYKSFYYALKDALEKAEVKVAGTMRLRKISANAHILFIHYSESLEKIISKTAKKSNNLYARHLLLYLGAKMYGAPATVAKGRKAVEYILRSKGALCAGTMKIDNGSGLSRSAKINAKILASMYDNAYRYYGQRWMNTLSIAGVDGTIKKRFRRTAVKNRAWMKTGTLKRVKNISGYVKSRSGRLYTVVILVNTKKGNWRAAKLQDDIIKWLVEYKEKRAQPSIDTLWSMETNEPSDSQGKTSPLQRYYVQVGLFNSIPDQNYLLRLEHLGLPYKVRHSDKYQVLVGAYKDEQSARTVLKKVRKHISSGAFLIKL